MNIVCIGAHPDDCEVFAGGTCAKWARAGHGVLMVALTNGDAGHYAMGGGPLAQRRAAEARESAARGGMSELILDNHDGELQPTLALRKQVVEIIREAKADVVLTHRPYDYHPDHRYTSVVVQDAAFMVTVPNVCPAVPPLRANPVFLYMMDRFTKPLPFRPDVAIAIDDAMDVKWSMLDAMESQLYEWLPWLEGTLEQVPTDARERVAWMAKTWGFMFEQAAQSARNTLAKWYGVEAAARVRFAETFELCEYGRQPSNEEIRQLFPFFPAQG